MFRIKEKGGIDFGFVWLEISEREYVYSNKSESYFTLFQHSFSVMHEQDLQIANCIEIICS